jgi:Ca-activated chloride channel family protein
MPTNYLDNYYARLGIAKAASQEELRRAYRRAARQLHPDGENSSGSSELFLLVQEAYEVLSSAERRAAYDATLPDDIEAPQALMVNTVYSRGTIIPGKEKQNIYVLLDLMAVLPEEGAPAAGRPPVNMSLVLDNSTSMAGPRLSRVTNAAAQFIRQIQPRDILSVVTFNDRAEVLVPGSAGQDGQRTIALLSSLQSKGGTELFNGLEAGLKEVQRHRNPAYTNHIILITDGRTYGDENQTLGLAQLAANLGISISVVGIGAEWNEDFIDQLVSKAGGNSVYAARSADIQGLLEEKFNTLNEAFANNVKLHYQLGKEVALHYAFRISPETSNIALQAPLFLGSVPLGTSLTVLMEFEVSTFEEKAGELILAQGELSLDVPFNPIPSTKTRFRLSLPIDAGDKPQTPPQMLVDAIAQLSYYRMQEEVRQRIKEGQAEKAAKRMRMLATHMLSAGQRGLAKTMLLEAEKLKQGQALDAKSGKQIKYGTRSLIEKPGRKESPR